MELAEGNDKRMGSDQMRNPRCQLVLIIPLVALLGCTMSPKAEMHTAMPSPAITELPVATIATYDDCERVSAELYLDYPLTRDIRPAHAVEWAQIRRATELRADETVARWREDTRNYMFRLRWDGSPELTTFWSSPAPRLESLFRCFGQPTLYTAYNTRLRGHPSFAAAFWFPSRGLSFLVGKSEFETKITVDMPLLRAWRVVPQSAEAAAAEWVAQGPLSDAITMTRPPPVIWADIESMKITQIVP